MRILVLNGSPRRDGNTSRVIDLLRERWTAPATGCEPVTVDVVRLTTRRITPCRGCRVCFDRGEEYCPVGCDDVPAVAEAIRGADALVLASPVYVNDVSGLTKTLIDRLAYVCHRPQFHHLAAMCLVTTAASPTRHALRTLQSAVVSWGADPAVSLGLATGALSERTEIAASHGPRIRAAADRMIRSVARAHVRHPSLLRLTVFRIQQAAWAKADPESIDYAYWRDNGWLEPATSFFFEHRSGPVRRAAARLAGGMTRRLFT